MRTIHLTRLAAALALTGAATLSHAASLIDPVVGFWKGTVTILSDCSGNGVPVFSFPVGQLIQFGGTFETTDYQPDPTDSGPGFGYWKREGPMKYFEKFEFVRYAADGSVAGFQRVTKHSSVADRNHKTADIVSEALDVDGNVLGSNCAVEDSMRFQ